jgi:hypothetical protein
MSISTNFRVTGYFFLSVVIALGAVRSTEAAQIERFNFGTDKFGILINGEFEAGDEKKFANLAMSISDAIVVFNSVGGNLVTGIEIGKAIRLKGFDTLVPSHTRCASACALAWLGGQIRATSDGALIGFHAAFDRESGEVTAAGNAVIGAYLSQLGLPTSAVIYITSPAPEEIRWLTVADARKYGIEVTILNDAKNQASGHKDAGHVTVPVRPDGTIVTGDSPAPGIAPIAAPPAMEGTVYLSAAFAGEGQPIRAGLWWRVFNEHADNEAGQRDLIAESRDPTPVLNLPDGDYIVHVSFGLAEATRRVVVNGQPVSERITIGDTPIPAPMPKAATPKTSIGAEPSPGHAMAATPRAAGSSLASVAPAAACPRLAPEVESNAAK